MEPNGHLEKNDNSPALETGFCAIPHSNNNQVEEKVMSSDVLSGTKDKTEGGILGTCGTGSAEAESAQQNTVVESANNSLDEQEDALNMQRENDVLDFDFAEAHENIKTNKSFEGKMENLRQDIFLMAQRSEETNVTLALLQKSLKESYEILQSLLEMMEHYVSSCSGLIYIHLIKSEILRLRSTILIYEMAFGTLGQNVE